MNRRSVVALAALSVGAYWLSRARRRTRAQRCLHHVACAGLSAAGPDELLFCIAHELRHAIGCRQIALGKIQADQSVQFIAVAEGPAADDEASISTARANLPFAAAQEAMRSGRLQVAHRIKPANASGVECFELTLPVVHKGKALAILCFAARRRPAPWERALLLGCAELAGHSLATMRTMQRLEQQAITDGLTGAKTRCYLMEALQAEFKRATRSGRPFSLVMMDLDKFKEVNDQQGHWEGDEVMARVGALLEQHCRQSNVVARYGGDEFAILMPEAAVEQAQVLAERLRSWLKDDALLAARGITGSFGVAAYPEHGESPEEIIRAADAALYESKRAGGNRAAIFRRPL